MSIVIGHYDWWLLSFAAVLAIIASLNAVRLFNFAQQRQGRAKAIAVLIAALACGCGMWAADAAAILTADCRVVDRAALTRLGRYSRGRTVGRCICPSRPRCATWRSPGSSW